MIGHEADKESLEPSRPKVQSGFPGRLPFRLEDSKGCHTKYCENPGEPSYQREARTMHSRRQADEARTWFECLRLDGCDLTRRLSQPTL